MPTRQRASRSLAALRLERDHISRCIAQLEAYTDTRARIATLIPRDQLMLAIAAGERRRRHHPGPQRGPNPATRIQPGLRLSA